MVGPWPHRAFTFRALSKTYGQMWLRCDVCRRYARLKLAGLHDVQDLFQLLGLRFGGLLLPGRADHGIWHDYRLDEVEKPKRHPDAVRRHTGLKRPSRSVDYSGGELPGRCGY